MTVLQKATRDDLELIMAWRSNPLVFQGFYQQQKPLTWDEHIRWWESRNQDWREFIVLRENRRVGVVTIGQLEHWSPEIGYFIGETTLWGEGVGRDAVKLGMGYIRNYGRDYCHTTVLKNNERSLRLLKSLGFSTLGDARRGEVWLQKKL
jgi:RimJ/RimL family protein N-acetyltransferase|tara:strand:- start:38 stop:487 length:450 start_codon:yes stop_codon:yes gene_type:complete